MNAVGNLGFHQNQLMPKPAIPNFKGVARAQKIFEQLVTTVPRHSPQVAASVCRSGKKGANASAEPKGQQQNLAPRSPQKFLTWLQQDIKRLGNQENAASLNSFINENKVSEKELRMFFSGLDEFVVLQILGFAQTSNSFNAIDEKIIEKALMLETNFIQAVNKKCPHRNPILREKIETACLGPSIFRYSMPEQEIVKIGAQFIDHLKSSGQLLTRKQFSDLNYKHWDKGSDLGRILGTDYIERLAGELGLKHIKVPKKIAVINEDVSELKLTVNKSTLELSCKGVAIHAEDIKPLARGATREEVAEFIKILEATGFSDFLGHNFFLGVNQKGEEGIYFIDTEYMNFRHAPFLETGIENIGSLVQKQDLDWINQPDVFPSYANRNKQRVNRYLKLYDIQEAGLFERMKTYVPEKERLKEDIKFTYDLKKSPAPNKQVRSRL